MSQQQTVRLKYLLALVAILFVGCAAEQESLHEHDHDVPEHWPSDMSEAAEFIELRVQQLVDSTAEAPEDTEDELQDLVEWAPEIAADTDLPEAAWIPVYEMSEVIRKHLQSSDVSAVEVSEDLQKLASLLRDAQATLPTEESADTTDSSGDVEEESNANELDGAAEDTDETPDTPAAANDQ